MSIAIENRAQTVTNTTWPELMPEDVFLSCGAWWATCDWCEGSGLFELPDGPLIPCNSCKTKGYLPVALEGEL